MARRSLRNDRNSVLVGRRESQQAIVIWGGGRCAAIARAEVERAVGSDGDIADAAVLAVEETLSEGDSARIGSAEMHATQVAAGERSDECVARKAGDAIRRVEREA